MSRLHVHHGSAAMLLTGIGPSPLSKCGSFWQPEKMLSDICSQIVGFYGHGLGMAVGRRVIHGSNVIFGMR